MVGFNVERIGAGLSAPQLRPEGMELKLNMIINQGSFRQAAKEFASRYQGTQAVNMTDHMASSINALLHEHRHDI